MIVALLCLSYKIRGKCLCLETLGMKYVSAKEGLGPPNIPRSDCYLGFQGSTKIQITGDCCVFIFLRCVDAEHLLLFGVNPPPFKFHLRGVDGDLGS